MEFLTYEVAVVLMLLGAVPSFVNVYVVWDDRYELGVSWFIASMVTGGLWALLYTSFTVVRSPEATLVLANFFWPLVPTAALTMFFLAYEFVFKQPVSRATVAALSAPIGLLFVLSWFNPGDLVFTADYYVGRDGYLYFPNFDGPLKILVTQLYGYLLVFLASGMFVGEALRTDGVRRKRVLYLLSIFTILVLSTMVKVAGLVPVYFDPTSVVYSASGLMFAYSINRYGLFKSNSIGREQTFAEVNDAILVVDSDGVVIDFNQRSYELFGYDVTRERVHSLIPEYDETETGTNSIQLGGDGEEARHFHCKTSPVRYGRRSEGKIIILNDVTELRKKEQDLHLLVQIFSRVYRHNMRNDFNVIQGYADMLKRESTGEVARMASRIEDKTDQLLQQATKARRIEGVFASTETVSRPLRGMVEEVRSSFEGRSDVVFEVSVDDVDVASTPGSIWRSGNSCTTRSHTIRGTRRSRSRSTPNRRPRTSTSRLRTTGTGSRSTNSPCFERERRRTFTTAPESACGWSGRSSPAREATCPSIRRTVGPVSASASRNRARLTRKSQSVPEVRSGVERADPAGVIRHGTGRGGALAAPADVTAAVTVPDRGVTTRPTRTPRSRASSRRTERPGRRAPP